MTYFNDYSFRHSLRRIASIVFIGGLFLTACQPQISEEASEYSESSETSRDSHSKSLGEDDTTQPPKKEIGSLPSEVFYKKYQAVQLGNNMSQSAMTSDEVIEIFGEPDNVDTPVDNIGSIQWLFPYELGTTIFYATFENNQIVGKAIYNIPIDTPQEITLEEYEALPVDGTYSFSQAIELLGVPQTIDSLQSSEIIFANWVVNIGTDRYLVNLHFNNEMLFSKDIFNQMQSV